MEMAGNRGTRLVKSFQNGGRLFKSRMAIPFLVIRTEEHEKFPTWRKWLVCKRIFQSIDGDCLVV
jgi:hypothetical protein